MRLMQATRLAGLLALVAVLGGLAVGMGTRAAEANDVSVRANVVVWKSKEGVARFCFDLRDAVSDRNREARQCPLRARLTVANAPESRWLRSDAVQIGPETAIWVRARRVGDQLEMGLGLSIEGEARGIRSRLWTLNWSTAATERWLRTSAITIQLPASLHAELWPSDGGMTAGAPRLEVGKPAPEFSLPVLGDDAGDPLPLSEARASGAGVTLIVFWASWAPYVDEALLALSALDQSYDQVQVIGINVYEVDESAAAAVAQSYGAGLLHLVDAEGSVAEHYRVDGLPELYLFDGNGVYRAVVRGAAPLNEILGAIEDAG